MAFHLKKPHRVPGFDWFGDDNLPSNRKELFFSSFHSSRFSIFLFSLGVFLIFLPSEVWCFVHLLLLKQWIVNADTVPSVNWLSRFLIGLIPLTALSGPFLAGFTRLARNWARGEFCHWFDVFRDAVKSSWAQALSLTFLTACLPLLIYSAVLFRQVADSIYANLLFFAVLAISLFWILILPLLFVMAVTYTLPFSHLLWNGSYLTFRNFFSALKLFLLKLLPLLVIFFLCAAYPYAFALLAAIYFAAYPLYLYGLHAFLSASYANAVCERELNPHIPTSRVDIGLCSEYTISEDS